MQKLILSIVFLFTVSNLIAKNFKGFAFRLNGPYVGLSSTELIPNVNLIPRNAKTQVTLLGGDLSGIWIYPNATVQIFGGLTKQNIRVSQHIAAYNAYPNVSFSENIQSHQLEMGFGVYKIAPISTRLYFQYGITYSATMLSNTNKYQQKYDQPYQGVLIQNGHTISPATYMLSVFANTALYYQCSKNFAVGLEMENGLSAAYSNGLSNEISDEYDASQVLLNHTEYKQKINYFAAERSVGDVFHECGTNDQLCKGFACCVM
jgi:hypothetical protein